MRERARASASVASASEARARAKNREKSLKNRASCNPPGEGTKEEVAFNALPAATWPDLTANAYFHGSNQLNSGQAPPPKTEHERREEQILVAAHLYFTRF